MLQAQGPRPPRGGGRPGQGRHPRRAGAGAAPGPAAAAPGPVLVLPGFLAGAEAYGSLQRALERRGHRCRVLPISKINWLPTLCGASFGFYLDAMNAAAEALLEEEEEAGAGGGRKLTLIGHSAGGWLARAWMGNEKYNGVTYGHEAMVERLITLGTPHLSVEKYPFGRVRERRRGERPSLSQGARGSSLMFTNECYPTAAAFSGVETLCVVGQVEAETVAGSYKATCGETEGVEGDGVCPIKSALLPGAEELVIPGVYHSPGGEGKWYGDEAIVDLWLSDE